MGKKTIVGFFAAAFIAASLVILSGSITMPEVYRAIEWKAIFLVAAVLPVGLAMERTGAAMLMANTVATVAGPIGNYATLAALIVLASLLSQGLDGAPAVVLLAPVVIQTADGLGISPYPLMMGVSLAASAAFMTPFSHKANLLVMGAGGYRSADYLKVGTPLTIVLVALMVLLVPGLLAFVFGWLAFRSRVTGVYLSIITQALTYALMLAFFRNEMGFGGNNGLTDFKDILGFSLQSDATKVGLFVASAVALALGYLACRWIVTSKLGRVTVAIRDAGGC